MGNIVAITVPIDGEKTYTYDPQGQMIQETIGDKTYTYTYDSVGNILSATKDGVAHTYTYGDESWGDLLTAYDGTAITYDAIGNPLTYYNGQSWNFTWVNGRTLSQAVSGDTTVSYVYDKTNDMRLSKIVGDTTYEYYYGDSQLLRMTVSDGTVMDFFYDHNGLPYAVKYNGTNYYYILNQQGDVVRLISADGTTVGTYQYDAWGNILSSTDNDLTNANPLRYRGYVYDDETGFYYISSRYYDPKIGRFVNVDGLVSTGQDVIGYNMFAYCGNNPVNRADPTGTFWKEVGNFFKNVGTAICNGAKKFVKAAVGSFQIEGGVGYGLGASTNVGPAKVSVSAYQDGLTIGFKNGSTYTAIKGGAGIAAQITKKARVGLSTEYEHRFETDLIRDWDEHTTMSAPWKVYNCPKTVKDPLQFSFPIVKPIEGNLPQGLFIGISAEAHIGVGGHFTTGWDATEFWQILTE